MSCPSIPTRIVPVKDVRLEATLTSEQMAEIAAKQVIYDGFKAAVPTGVQDRHPGRRTVRGRHPARCCGAWSWQVEFDFEYGDDARHLLRYNSEGDQALNRGRQSTCAVVRAPGRQRTRQVAACLGPMAKR
jgi:hypothetical protein